LNEKEVEKMFSFMAKRPETKKFGAFLRQIANAYKNKYLYTKDESLKGSIYSFITLAEKFEEKSPKKKAAEEKRQKKVVGDKNRKVKY
jgi:hypothetical protein